MYFPTGFDSLESNSPNKPSTIFAENIWCDKKSQLRSMGFIIAAYVILPQVKIKRYNNKNTRIFYKE